MSDQDTGPAPRPSPRLSLVPAASAPAPAHALDPRRSDEPRTSKVEVSRAELFDLLQEIKQLSPCHRDPHKFHARKDEIAARLYEMATVS